MYQLNFGLTITSFATHSNTMVCGFGKYVIGVGSGSNPIREFSAKQMLPSFFRIHIFVGALLQHAVSKYKNVTIKATPILFK
jgi:hypothetical protein